MMHNNKFVPSSCNNIVLFIRTRWQQKRTRTIMIIMIMMSMMNMTIADATLTPPPTGPPIPAVPSPKKRSALTAQPHLLRTSFPISTSRIPPPAPTRLPASKHLRKNLRNADAIRFEKINEFNGNIWEHKGSISLFKNYSIHKLTDSTII